jgi:hypothetical protein
MMISLQVGKQYKRRDGALTKITFVCASETHPYVSASGSTYLQNGSYLHTKHEHLLDIVSEIEGQEEQEVTKEELLAMLVRMQCALGEFCCAFGISYGDMEDEHRDLLQASEAADALIKRAKQ